MCDFTLLFVVVAFKFSKLCSLSYLKLGVISRVQLYGAIVNVSNMTHAFIQKLSVVRNKQQGTSKGLDPISQPNDRI